MITAELISIHGSQSQFPDKPLLAIIPHITSGVSAAKVVATIEIPASHQGIFLLAKSTLPYFSLKSCRIKIQLEEKKLSM